MITISKNQLFMLAFGGFGLFLINLWDVALVGFNNSSILMIAVSVVFLVLMYIYYGFEHSREKASRYKKEGYIETILDPNKMVLPIYDKNDQLVRFHIIENKSDRSHVVL